MSSIPAKSSEGVSTATRQLVSGRDLSHFQLGAGFVVQVAHIVPARRGKEVSCFSDIVLVFS